MTQLSEARTLLRVDVRDGAPRTTIERSHDLELMLLERLADGQLRMPPYPAIAMKLKQLAERGRSSTGEIAAAISADAALVAAVLRSANAAALGAAQPVISLDIAIGRLGLEQIVRIAIAQSVGSAMNTSGPLRTLRREVWRRSLLSAAIASELAPTRSVDRDAAFVAGLLHDFGAITVLVGLEDLGVELPVLSAASWRRFVDRLHAPFGRVFAQRWKLPEPIADAIEHWAQPRAYDGPHRGLVDLIASSVAIVETLDRAPSEGLESLQHVEGLERREAERVHQLVPRIAELMDSFEASTSAQAPAGPVAASVVADSAVEPGAPPEEVQWPIDVPATCKGETLRACAIDPNSVVMIGTKAMELNWLVQVALQCEPRVTFLGNITGCATEPDGAHRITARPFALGGAEKEAWQALVQRARTAAQEAAQAAAPPAAAAPADDATAAAPVAAAAPPVPSAMDGLPARPPVPPAMAGLPTRPSASPAMSGAASPPPVPARAAPDLHEIVGTAEPAPPAPAFESRAARASEPAGLARPSQQRIVLPPQPSGVTLAQPSPSRLGALVPLLVLGVLSGVLVGVGSAFAPQALGVCIAVAAVLSLGGFVWSAKIARAAAR